VKYPRKYCPKCNAEYRHTAETCSDCGITLTFEDPERPIAELSPAEPFVLLEVGDPWPMRRMAEALQQSGIPSQIDSYPPGTPLSAGPGGRYGFETPEVGIYVRPNDLPQARSVINDFVRSRMPKPPGDSSAPDSESDLCPACGSQLAPNSSSCSDCGIEFPRA